MKSDSTSSHGQLAFTSENQPNAAILIDSLRYMGYDNFSAVADLVDNGFDAEASHVAILIDREENDWILRVLDDGNGMDLPKLDEALKLGSNSPRNILSDLGKYGMGLSTASLSLGRRTDVVTRSVGQVKTYRSVTDVDEIRAKNAFVKFLGEASHGEEREFEALMERAGLSDANGTIVTVSKADGVKYSSTGHFLNALKKHLSQTFRKFLAAGKTISINGEKLDAFEPLLEGTEVFSDDTYDFTTIDENGEEKVEQFRLVMGLLQDFGSEGNRSRSIDLKHQGFYILRNNREIAEAETLGLYTRHNDFNRFRAELFMPATLDVPLGVNFTKRSVKLNQALSDKLASIVKGQLATIRSRTRRQVAQAGDDAENHTEAARVIGQKSHLLQKPKAQVEVREPRTDGDERPEKPEGTPGKRNGRTPGKTRSVESLQNARFEAVSLGEGGQIYEAAQEGKTVIVRWNVDHPFYNKFIVNNGDKGMVTAIDFFIFSMATAELMYWGDETADLIDQMKSIVSANTRTLLK